MPPQLKKCNFCGRNEKQVLKLFTSGTGSNICDDCIVYCYELLMGDELGDAVRPRETKVEKRKKTEEERKR